MCPQGAISKLSISLCQYITKALLSSSLTYTVLQPPSVPIELKSRAVPVLSQLPVAAAQLPCQLRTCLNHCIDEFHTVPGLNRRTFATQVHEGKESLSVIGAILKVVKTVLSSLCEAGMSDFLEDDKEPGGGYGPVP